MSEFLVLKSSKLPLPLYAPPFIGTLFIENLDLAIQSLLGKVCKGLNSLLF